MMNMMELMKSNHEGLESSQYLRKTMMIVIMITEAITIYVDIRNDEGNNSNRHYNITNGNNSKSNNIYDDYDMT